jgi:hypothetical protein
VPLHGGMRGYTVLAILATGMSAFPLIITRGSPLNTLFTVEELTNKAGLSRSWTWKHGGGN